LQRHECYDKEVKLARINTVLLAAIVVINGYLLCAPFFPQLSYWWQDHRHSPSATEALAKVVAAKPSSSTPVPKGDWLVVPSMHLDDQIIEGRDASVLKYGPWRRPSASTPDKGGNTVIVGHRYTYTDPRGIFYYLNKVQIGDQIAIFWQGKKYTYGVTTISQVSPNSTGVEAPTQDAQLTLYTCTPLWLPTDRLVVVAKLLEVKS
jgi:sortase A